MTEKPKTFTRFVIKLTNDAYSEPVTRAQLEEYINENQVGGEIFICHMVPFAQAKVIIDWEEAFGQLEEKSDVHTPDTKKGDSGKSKPKVGAVRKGADTAPRATGANRKGRPGSSNEQPGTPG